MRATQDTVTDGRAKKTLASLRRALLALLERKQFDEVTVKDIISEAGIGLATFYRHYETKNALLEAVAAVEIDALVNMAVSLLGRSGGGRSAEALISYVNEHRALWSVLLSGGAAGAMREGFIRRVAEAYNVDGKPQATWVPQDLGIIFGVTATVEIIAWWLRQPPGLSISEVADILDGLAIQPTLKRPGQHDDMPTFRLLIEANVKLE